MMDASLAIIYGDEFLRYDFGTDHPLRPIRLKMAMALMDELGLTACSGVATVAPKFAALDDALLFHNRHYLEFVARQCALGDGWLDDSRDTPAFRQGLESALWITGGTLRAAEMVAAGEVEHAFNLGGGLHHAYPDHASGFCIVNDVAIAVERLKQLGVKRIMYVDIDAHLGDGVLYGFYEDGGVLNVDFHEDGRHLFPGRGHIGELGRGDGLYHKVNVPFPRYAGDSSFRYAFRELVPDLAGRYRPEIIIMQCGVDGHANDPLTSLRYSSNSFAMAIDVVHELAHDICGGKLVLVGGGGYDPGTVAVSWAHMVARLVGQALPDELPESWRCEFRRMTDREAPATVAEKMAEDPTFHETWANVTWLKRRLGLDRRGMNRDWDERDGF